MPYKVEIWGNLYEQGRYRGVNPLEYSLDELEREGWTLMHVMGATLNPGGGELRDSVFIFHKPPD